MNHPVRMKVRAGNAVYEVAYAQNGDSVDVTIDDRSYKVHLSSIREDFYSLLIDDRSVDAQVFCRDNRFTVGFSGYECEVEFFDPRTRRPAADMGRQVTEGKQHIQAPMAGKIVNVLVKQDDGVEAGEGLIVLEAMKMENKLVAPGTARVLDILVSDQETVETGQNLMIIEMAGGHESAGE